MRLAPLNHDRYQHGPDAGDIHLLRERFRARDMNAGSNTPRILRIPHTDADTLQQLDAAAVSRALVSIELAIRRLDESFTP